VSASKVPKIENPCAVAPPGTMTSIATNVIPPRTKHLLVMVFLHVGVLSTIQL
jgi:hypothetical protein